MSATHDSNIAIAITLAAAPLSSAGLQTVKLFVPLAANSLDGEDRVTYTSYADAVTDEAAGYISSGTLAALQVAFSQRPQPAAVKVASVDLAGDPAETYVQALAREVAADSDFFAVCITSRADQDIEDVAAAVEALGDRIFVFQSDNADIITTGFPAALADTEDLEDSVGVYHDTDAKWGDVAYAVARLAFDPDVRSAGWVGQVRGVTAYATGLTTAQRDFALENNFNLMLPFGSISTWMSPGVNMAGREVKEIITALWLKARLTTDLISLVSDLAARGEYVAVNADGQAQILKVVKARFLQGEGVGHFERGQTDASPVTITQADRDARRIRIQAAAQLQGTALTFSLAFNLARTPLE